MPSRQRPFILLVSLLLPAVTAGTLIAQSNSEINSRVQFNFSPPGARSLALGGAFLALADDATAAYTNPAGLTNLSRPEVSLEGRVSQFTNTYLSGGRIGGTLTNTGIDTVNSPIDASSKNTTRGISYVSLVYPGKTWAIAVFRDELANFKASSKTQGAFFGGTDNQGNPFGRRFFPVIGTLDLKIVSYGAAVAYRFGETLSLGLGVSRFEYTQHSVLTRYGLVGSEVPNYAPSNAFSREGVQGDDHAVAVNAGLLWKIGPRVSVGAVYRQGPHFKTTASDQEDLTQALPPPPCASSSVNCSFLTTFHVPDVYGAGVSARPTKELTLSFDYDRVRYSQFGSGTVDIFRQGSTYASRDGNEYHLGAQYLLQLGNSVLAIRAGSWREPAHSVVAASGNIQNTDSLDTIIIKTTNKLLFPEGSAKTHYAGGLGITIGEHFQLDAGADFAKDSAKIGSLSFVVRL